MKASQTQYQNTSARPDWVTSQQQKAGRRSLAGHEQELGTPASGPPGRRILTRQLAGHHRTQCHSCQGVTSSPGARSSPVLTAGVLVRRTKGSDGRRLRARRKWFEGETEEPEATVLSSKIQPSEWSSLPCAQPTEGDTMRRAGQNILSRDPAPSTMSITVYGTAKMRWIA
jgi:hypothetical protein